MCVNLRYMFFVSLGQLNTISNMRLLLLVNLLTISIALSAQTFRVLPYLQEATPNSIYILWETVGGEESTVE